MARPWDCQKYVVLWCNDFVLGVLGLTLSALAIKFLVQLNTYGQLGPEDVCGPPVSVLVLGIITFLLSYYSYRVINYSNRCQIYMLIIYLGTILCASTAVEIWSIVSYTQVTEPPGKILEYVRKSLVDPVYSDFWNKTYEDLNCCGVFGVADYALFNLSDFPVSCSNDTYGEINKTRVAVHGCASEALNYTKSVLLKLILALTGLIIYEMGILIPMNVLRVRFLERRIREIKAAYTSATSEARQNDAPRDAQTSCDSANTNVQVYHIT